MSTWEADSLSRLARCSLAPIQKTRQNFPSCVLVGARLSDMGLETVQERRGLESINNKQNRFETWRVMQNINQRIHLLLLRQAKLKSQQ